MFLESGNDFQLDGTSQAQCLGDLLCDMSTFRFVDREREAAFFFGVLQEHDEVNSQGRPLKPWKRQASERGHSPKKEWMFIYSGGFRGLLTEKF